MERDICIMRGFASSVLQRLTVFVCILRRIIVEDYLCLNAIQRGKNNLLAPR
jgi:hypothetical protein